MSDTTLNNDTRWCIEGHEFTGMGCYVFRRTAPTGVSMERLPDEVLMCVEHGANNRNLLPYFKWAGVLSEGTLNPDHLIPRYTRVLVDLMGRDKFKAWADKNWFCRACLMSDSFSDSPCFDLESESGEVLATLSDKLDDLAPEFYHFGSIEGDGACIGFWLNTEPV